MRKTIAAILLVVTLSPVNTSAKDIFTIGISSENTSATKELKTTLTEAYARAGYGVHFTDTPRLRTYQAANLGETDSIAVCSQDALKAYPNLMLLPTPIAQVTVTAISLTPSVAIAVPEDLEHYSVGVLRGQLLAVNFAKKHASRVDEVNTLKNLIGMLKLGRVDAVLLNQETARIFMTETGITHYTESEPLLSVYLYHAINRNAFASEQVTRIDNALREMIEDGTMKKLYGKLSGLVPTLPLQKN
jgi:ABC-type amino acid transport substrate-binding protein